MRSRRGSRRVRRVQNGIRGLAADLAEADQQNLANRWQSNPAAGGTVEAIISEVLRRLAVTDEAGRELVREAVEDAIEGRRPRW